MKRAAYLAVSKSSWMAISPRRHDIVRGEGHVSTTGSQLFTTIFLRK